MVIIGGKVIHDAPFQPPLSIQSRSRTETGTYKVKMQDSGLIVSSG